MYKIKDTTAYLESIAPRAYQESYDNSGLITGNPNDQIKGVLISLDCTEDIVEEAIAKDCNLIIAHHPIIFKGLKTFTGKNYVERTVINAIKNDIAIYAIHTNLDNIAGGVSYKIAEKLELENVRILAPQKSTLSKLVAFVPTANTSEVLEALYNAGAGEIGDYSNCSFTVNGQGTFKPNEKANPHIGSANNQEVVKEDRIELIFPTYLTSSIVNALKKAHPYEEVAHYITSLENANHEVGSGIVADLQSPLEPEAFLQHLKDKMNLKVIRHTTLTKKVKCVAICGGAGSFLLSQAKRAGADAFVTGDFKYHEFFDAENQLMICDIGHYESEVFTKDLINELLNKKFNTFAICLSEVNTNPISYF